MGEWCTATEYGPGDEALAEWCLRGPGLPGIGVVDDLARLQLGARRRGNRLVLSVVSSELAELLELCGLTDLSDQEPAIGRSGSDRLLGRQVCGQPEGREDVLRVEEAVESADPTV